MAAILKVKIAISQQRFDWLSQNLARRRLL